MLMWYTDEQVPVPELREHPSACDAYSTFHHNYSGNEKVVDISHDFKRWVHTLEYSHCQASDMPHEGRMGRGGAVGIAINAFHGACIQVPYLTAGPVAHATGLVGQWTTIQNCLQFLMIMHRRGIYHEAGALAAKQYLARHVPEDIEDLELVVRRIRKALRSLHHLNAGHLEKISAKVSTVTASLVVKKTHSIGPGIWGLGP